MACCCGTTFNSCADCCPQWTLPGGATAVPTEIQAEVSVAAFDVCYVAGVSGGSLTFCGKKDTVSLSNTYTLTRVSTTGNACGTWRYFNCSNNESVSVEVRLSYNSTTKQCVWAAGVNYEKCLPCTAWSSAYNNSANLCCNGTDYGFKARAQGGSINGVISGLGDLPTVTMTFPCAAGIINGAGIFQRNGTSSGEQAWAVFCARNGINCTTCSCDSTNLVSTCPDSPSSTITVTISV